MRSQTDPGVPGADVAVFDSRPLPETVRAAVDELDVEALIEVVQERCATEAFGPFAHDEEFRARLRASIRQNAYALREVLAGRADPRAREARPGPDLRDRPGAAAHPAEVDDNAPTGSASTPSGRRGPGTCADGIRGLTATRRRRDRRRPCRMLTRRLSSPTRTMSPPGLPRRTPATTRRSTGPARTSGATLVREVLPGAPPASCRPPTGRSSPTPSTPIMSSCSSRKMTAGRRQPARRRAPLPRLARPPDARPPAHAPQRTAVWLCKMDPGAPAPLGALVAGPRPGCGDSPSVSEAGRRGSTVSPAR